MYAFVFEWTPALTVPEAAPPGAARELHAAAAAYGGGGGEEGGAAQWGRRLASRASGEGPGGGIPHGQIFATFMLCCMCGAQVRPPRSHCALFAPRSARGASETEGKRNKEGKEKRTRPCCPGRFGREEKSVPRASLPLTSA